MVLILVLALGLVGFGLLRRQQSRIVALEQRIEKLEQGVIPEHEQAKAAAAAVNDFNAGIVGIFGYDPYDARRAAKE